ncbi:MAG TPA: autotransporter-associated beta strand repeat-containing protein [Candidatus Paceibacterota bacterium]|nr:autotransporter-associated beta strand repeat-containing protein [Verrucomicrobiota bacterium]HRZ45376.1 autotransporter-associated beta strand repeat-containing protein [Candidatus Paceibacterota bacterium]HRZ93053.1 autotransporter-associated beta strand repeat-containing protein [Candidatus Paceibacterota bacterium]
MNTKLPCIYSLGALLAAVLLNPIASADTVSWTGAGGNDNWSTPGNWAGGAPEPGNAILFNDDDATGFPGLFGTPNNIVDVSVAIQSLKYGNTNQLFHTTQIPAGSVLSVEGTVNPVLMVGTGQDNGAAQTVYATVLGQGSLFVTNTAGIISVIQGSATAGAKLATLDMEGLETFTAYVSQIRVAAENGGSSTPQYNRPNATLLLAKTNLLSCAGNPGLLVSRTTGNGGTCDVRLGQENTILSDGGITVGGRKSVSSKLSFNTITFFSPRAVFRNLAGTGRQGTWIVGDEIEQTGTSSAAAVGSIDFTSGTVDALVDTIIVGRGSGTSGGQGSGTGTITFDAGVIDANTVNIGMQAVATGGPGRGTVNVNGTAQLVANGVLRLAAGGAPSTGTLNINGGRVLAQAIENGGGELADVSITAGVLVVTNSAGSPDRPLSSLTVTDGVLAFGVGEGSTNLHVVNFSDYSGNRTTIDILFLPPITGYPAQLPLIGYQAFAPGFNELALGNLPAATQAYTGYISNNAARSRIDLVITGGPAPVRALTWDGKVDGKWDTATANWLHGGGSTAYNQGDFVTFNDSASGVTAVDLTMDLAPLTLTIDNSAKSYTLAGPGSIGGEAALVKMGSGSLILGNSGANTFSGGVAISGGSLQLSGGADRLPTNSTVTLSNVPGAVLDLNGQDQAVAALDGGGALGGDVALGSATLTISGGGGVHAGAVSGGGAVVKSGSGTQVLAGANLYSGGTVVSGGTLAVANASGSGTGSGGVLVETNGIFQIGDGVQPGSVSAGAITNHGILRFNAAEDFTFGALVVGEGIVSKAGPNIVTLPAAQTYTNQTTITGGALRPAHPQAFGTTDGPTVIGNAPNARLELAGGIVLDEPLVLNQKQSAAGNVPGIRNVSGTNTLSGPIELITGGSYWIVHSDAGKLIVSGPAANTTTAGTRALWLSGDGDGEWNSGLTDGAGGNLTQFRKDGAGTWVLDGVCTYSGTTVVSNGTLLVNTAIGGSGVTVAGGVLGGRGSISSPVTVGVSGALAPGAGIGSLAVQNNLTLLGAAVMEVSSSGSDQVSGIQTLTLGGTLRVVAIGPLAGGEVFKLFSAASFADNFTTYDLPVLPSPLGWDYSSVPVDGTLRVTGGLPKLEVERSGDTLTFRWIEAGLKLQAQTNSLSLGIRDNWHDYPGGSASGATATIDPANPAVFFRLITQ